MTVSSTDQALALVKDAKNFEAKLKELAKAEKGANEALEKSRRANKEFNAQMDKRQAEVDEQLKTVRAKVQSAEGVANAAMKDVIKEKGDIQKREKKLADLIKKVDFDRAGLEVREASLKEKELSLHTRIEAFENGVKSLVQSTT